MATVETQRRVKRLRRLARLMDSAIGIPGTRWRFGLDPAVGLVPVIGDLAGLVVAAWIVLQAWRLGAARGTLVRMGLNIVADGLIGSIPLVGDILDAFARMNERNVRLLERDLGLGSA